jgi:CHAT domain
LITILFLSANPSETQRLQLAEECNEIDKKLRMASEGDRFRIEQHHAISVKDLSDTLMRYQPDIVHFSGHGRDDGAIVFQDSEGHEQPVPPDSLTRLFQILNNDSEKKIRCVLLNACYAAKQAEAIANHVDSVIGMSTAVSDKAAIEFAAYFYQGLGYGKNLKTAFDLGCIQLGLEGNTTEENTPQLICREGTNAKDISFIKKSKKSNSKKQTIGNKNGSTTISGTNGDIIGVNVSGSGNIIGKGINVK